MIVISTMRPVYPLFFAALLFLSPHSIVPVEQGNWKLKRDRKGIKVYTRSVKGFDLDEFKGKTVINVPVKTLVRTLKDVQSMPMWIPDCKVARLLKTENNNQYHYIESVAPFPLSNRDMVLHFQYNKYKDGIKVAVVGKPKHLPVKDGLVRIPYIKGYWLFTPLSENKTAVMYQVHVDPGGSIPAWLANTASVDTPFDTLKNLRDYLK